MNISLCSYHLGSLACVQRKKVMSNEWLLGWSSTTCQNQMISRIWFKPDRTGRVTGDYQDVSSSNKAIPRQLCGDNDHTPTLPTRREIWVPKAIKMCLLPNHWFLSIRTLHKCEICIPPETEHLSRCHMRMKLISDICGWSYGNLTTSSPIKPKRSYSSRRYWVQPCTLYLPSCRTSSRQPW